MKAQVKSRDDYIIVVKETVKENEANYHKHLETVRREYEKLEDNNKMLKERIAEQNTENQSLRLQAMEYRNEASK